MNFSKIKELLFARAKELNLCDYDIYFCRNTDRFAGTVNHELSAVTSGTAGGVCFRCAVNGKIGSASTESLEEEDLLALVPRALSNASVIDTDEEAIFYAPGEKDVYGSVNCRTPKLPDAATIRHDALEIEEALYHATELAADGTESGVGCGEVELSLSNSKGLSLSRHAAMCYQYANLVVKKGEEAVYGFSVKADEKPDVAGIVSEAKKDALSKLDAGTARTGRTDVIFSEKEVRTLLSAFEGIFNGKNALEGLSLLKGKEGTKIAADCVTLIDDPFYAENPMQIPFDAEGLPTREKALVKDGCLETLLYDLTTAKKAGAAPTGNAVRATYASPVSISHFCLRLAPGQYTHEELLKELGDGLYITELKGLHAGANAETGDFSIESAGFEVKNGEMAGAVRGFTLAGNFYQLLLSVEKIGSCVKMGMPGFHTLAAPEILVRGLSVAGGD